MTIIYRFVGVKADGRTFGGNATSPDLQSDGYALDPMGCDLSRMKGPTSPLLWQHDTNSIVGKVTDIRATETAMPFKAKFLDAGASQLADKLCRELKGGAPYGVSVGFEIDDWKPLGNGKKGRLATKWTLLELSLCSVPVDPKAIITERARRAMSGVQAAMNACDRATAEHRAVGRHHGEMSDELSRLDQHRQTAGTALRGLKRALDAQTSAGQSDGESDDPYDVGEAQAQCQRSVEAIGRSLKAVADRHGDATDAHTAMKRALREVATAYGSGPVQTSSGLTDGESADRAHRRRQVEVLELAAPTADDDYSRRQRALEVFDLAAAAD